jgi:hypothetical protein
MQMQPWYKWLITAWLPSTFLALLRHANDSPVNLFLVYLVWIAGQFISWDPIVNTWGQSHP